MHSTICAIMHLFLTYQKKICQLYPVTVYRGVPRSVHSEFAVCGCSILTVHVAFPLRDADTKHLSSVKQNRRGKYLLFVEQNGRLFVYGDFSN